ncbi:shikimate kinase [Kocuria massiliensis]|uniref:shikimate kinase n=1 Tax=Kocuria massiliensis TaxID=1926282 RepID=UPI000A1CA385|nr:shikimate kinase [Kocuria massiliensis]
MTRDGRASIILIGPMAAGKSWLGRGLAQSHGYAFVDSDEYIVAHHGEIARIFVDHGEAHFRDLEASSIEEILREDLGERSVVSLGGGAPMSERVRRLLQGHTVVFVRVDADTVRPRIMRDASRPMLQPDPMRRWQEIFDERVGTYEELADIVVDASGPRDVPELVEEIHHAVQDKKHQAESESHEVG